VHKVKCSSMRSS